LLHSDTYRSDRPPDGGAKAIHGSIVIKIKNGGLGPAVVTKYCTYINGAAVDVVDRKDGAAALKDVFDLDIDNCALAWYSLRGGAVVIPKDACIEALSLQFWVRTKEEYDAVLEKLPLVNLMVEYQSLYGDELVFYADKPPLPPKLSLFWVHKR
jgi:hypothetical protein